MGISTCIANYGIRYFIAMIWITINILVFWRTYAYYKYDLQYYYLHEMLGPSLCVSRGTANVLNLNLGVMLLPMCRALTTWLRSHRLAVTCGSIRRLLDHTKGFHILCSSIVGICSVIHYFAHVYNAERFSANFNYIFEDINSATTPKQNPLLLVMSSFPGLTGFMMMLIISVIISSSRVALRHSNYEIFCYTHKLFIILYLLLLIHGLGGILKAQGNTSVHRPGCQMMKNVTEETMPNPKSAFPESNGEDSVAYPEPSEDVKMKCKDRPQFHKIGSSSWKWLIFPLFIYICDAIWRYALQKRMVTFITDVIPHPGDVMELRFSCDTKFHCKPGQYVLVRSPVIHPLESHPYTITKCPSFQDREFAIHMKISGDWSDLMMQHLVQADTATVPLMREGTSLTEKVYIEGPFSSPMEDILRYKFCLYVGGGIGITPFISICSYILETGDAGCLVRIRLVWVCRTIEIVKAFDKNLESLHNYLWSINKPDFLEVQFHVTQHKPVLGMEESSFVNRRLYQGRPDLKSLITEMSDRYKGSTVGVFSCGPKSLHNELEKVCSHHGKSAVKFICYHDSF